MIFETLYDSAQKGELLLVEGGMCHFHLRRDEQLTIREIIVTHKNQGIGKKILEYLESLQPESLFAKCPENLNANKWYAHQGFKSEGEEITKTGRKLLLWRKKLR
jgi:hypothetical protein